MMGKCVVCGTSFDTGKLARRTCGNHNGKKPKTVPPRPTQLYMRKKKNIDSNNNKSVPDIYQSLVI